MSDFVNAGHTARIALMRLYPERMYRDDPEAFWRLADEAFPGMGREQIESLLQLETEEQDA